MLGPDEEEGLRLRGDSRSLGSRQDRRPQGAGELGCRTGADRAAQRRLERPHHTWQTRHAASEENGIGDAASGQGGHPVGDGELHAGRDLRGGASLSQ